MTQKSEALEAQIEQLLGAVRSGTNLMTACQYAKLNTGVVFGWMERGRLEEDRLNANPRSKPKPSEEGCLQIWQDLKQANAEATARMEAVIVAAAQEGEWKAAAWYLERRHPETYGKAATERKPQNLASNPLPQELEA